MCGQEIIEVASFTSFQGDTQGCSAERASFCARSLPLPITAAVSTSLRRGEGTHNGCLDSFGAMLKKPAKGDSRAQVPGDVNKVVPGR